MDVFPEEQVIGGAPFNFAAILAHLGNEAYLLSAVGRDELETERELWRTTMASRTI